MKTNLTNQMKKEDAKEHVPGFFDTSSLVWFLAVLIWIFALSFPIAGFAADENNMNTKITFLPANNLHSEVAYQFNGDNTIETVDTTFYHNTPYVKKITSFYANGTWLDSAFTRKGELKEVRLQSPGSDIRITYRHGKVAEVVQYVDYIDPNSSDSKYNKVPNGECLFFDEKNLTDVIVFKKGNLIEQRGYVEGNMMFKMEYDEVTDEATYYEYYPSGKLRMKSQKNGEINDGMTTLFYEDGRQQGVFEFHNGILLGGATYSPEGEVVSNVAGERRKNDSWYLCYEDGGICCECWEKKGKVKCIPADH